MVGAIIRGVLKSKYKPKPKSKYPKTVSRKLKREAKIHPADKYLSKFEAGAITGGAGVLGTQAILKSYKAKKDAKAASDKKLKKSIEKHKKKTQEKRRKYGKHHG